MIKIMGEKETGTKKGITFCSQNVWKHAKLLIVSHRISTIIETPDRQIDRRTDEV